jgi:hypothetical protein
MKLIETLFESNEDRIIAKAKHVYKAFKKGRGMVKIAWFDPADVSYELPDISRCEFQVRPSWEDEGEMMGVITMLDPVKFKIHNLIEVFGEEGDEGREERIINNYIDQIGYVYRKKFDQFGIAIGTSS